jgi:hypothetical protein
MLGAGVRVVDDQHQARRTADGEFLAVEPELAHQRVVDPHGGAVPGPHVMARPQLPETRADQGKLPDEFDESGIVGVGADGFPEARHQALGGLLPVRVEGLFAGVEEHVAQPVGPGRQAWRERGRQGVGSEHVEVASLHERG